MDTTFDDLFHTDIEEDVVPQSNIVHSNSNAIGTSLRMRPLNLADQVKKRKTGLTQETFDMDVMLYEEQLNSCHWPDETDIHREIQGWDFSTPTKECFDRNKIAMTYARLNAYRHRLGELLAEAATYKNVAVSAHKSLKETAFALYTGIQKEREANASFRVRPFELESIYAEGVLTYLKETDRALETMFINMNSNLKHLDNLSRVNNDFESTGRSYSYENMDATPARFNDDASEESGDDEGEEEKPFVPRISGIRVRSRGNF